MERPWKYVLIGAIGALLLAAGMAVGFIFIGLYPIAANEPHSVAIGWVLTALQENSVRVHASLDDREMPDLNDPSLQALGAIVYAEHCAVCHGAPGVERAILGRGLNPDPPRLATEVRDWSDDQLYWIVANGLKMAGMPAFQPGLSDEQVWSTVAFMRALPNLTPEDYREALAAAPSGRAAMLEERNRAAMEAAGAEGDPARGRLLVEAYGCGSCHQIPGVANSRGHVGPPLDGFGLRHYVAGAVLNNPRNLAQWLYDPASIEPGTAMPPVGATVQESIDMAAYLLTLGADESLVGPRGILPARWLPR